jgi:hypothetical protein
VLTHPEENAREFALATHRERTNRISSCYWWSNSPRFLRRKPVHQDSFNDVWPSAVHLFLTGRHANSSNERTITAVPIAERVIQVRKGLVDLSHTTRTDRSFASRCTVDFFSERHCTTVHNMKRKVADKARTSCHGRLKTDTDIRLSSLTRLFKLYSTDDVSAGYMLWIRMPEENKLGLLRNCSGAYLWDIAPFDTDRPSDVLFSCLISVPVKCRSGPSCIYR